MRKSFPQTGYISLFVLLLPAFSSALLAQPDDNAMPAEFVDAATAVPELVVEMRYTRSHNFAGKPINGYYAPRCLLTEPAALALAAVQAELKPMGLGLKVYDCYRPQQAVDHFVAWAKVLEDQLTKSEFYLRVDKKDLFSKGYIAAKSSHSRGSTVDITLIPLPPPSQEIYQPGQPLISCTASAGQRFGDNSLDMGTGYDCFDPLSHTANPAIAPQQRANRLLLKSLMEKHGFENLDVEWWHYTLKQEPFPDRYFNFPVR